MRAHKGAKGFPPQPAHLSQFLIFFCSSRVSEFCFSFRKNLCICATKANNNHIGQWQQTGWVEETLHWQEIWFSFAGLLEMWFTCCIILENNWEILVSWLVVEPILVLTLNKRYWKLKIQMKCLMCPRKISFLMIYAMWIFGNTLFNDTNRVDKHFFTKEL